MNLPTPDSATLDDLSPMPFGKHKGCPMQDVPASYLHYLWCNGINKQKEHPIHVYIKDRLNALKEEDPDKIWE